MKSRGEGARPRRGLDGHARDSITALVGVAVVVVAAFGACNLDDKNPPLGNEAPNRGQFVGGIAIGAGPGGTGGSGGSGTGGSGGTVSSSGGSAPANCSCAVAFSSVIACSDCFNTLCDPTVCGNDVQCAAALQTLAGCGGDPTCVEGALASPNANFQAYVTCGCESCGPSPGSGDCVSGTTCP